MDFFCGAGGTTRGLIDAGGYVIAGIDKEPTCEETYVRNNVNTTLDRHPARYIRMDIFDRTEDYPAGQGDELMGTLMELLDRYQTLEPDIPLLFSICAPCQPFSQATRGILSEERSNGRVRDRALLTQTFRFIEEFSPSLVLSENVKGIQDAAYGGVWQEFAASLEADGFVVGSAIVDAARFGIPQHRKRSIMLAVRKRECIPSMIVERDDGTVGLEVPLEDPMSPPVTAREALERFPPIKAGEIHPTIPNHQASRLSETNIRRIRLAEPGGTNVNLGELALPCHTKARSKQRMAFADIYSRMDPNRCAPTMTTKCVSITNGRFGHYDTSQDRGISVREAAALQSFPDDYVFYRSMIGSARMVGNAVPPRLAAFFARTLVGTLQAGAAPFYCRE